METINKLLKKQPPKTRGRGAAAAAASGLGGDETPMEPDVPRANPVFVRWTSNAQGSVVAVPDEMLAGPVGSLFGGPGRQQQPGGGARKMVEEVA